MAIFATSIDGGGFRVVGAAPLRATVGMRGSPGPAVIRKRVSGGGSEPDCPASSL